MGEIKRGCCRHKHRLDSLPRLARLDLPLKMSTIFVTRDLQMQRPKVQLLPITMKCIGSDTVDQWSRAFNKEELTFR